MMAEAIADAPAEEEALPEHERPTAQEPATGMIATEVEIQIPTWNLGERIPIAPQVWDADTPKVGVGVVEDDEELVTLDDSEIPPAVPEPLKKSPKDKRKEKWKRSVQQETDGRLVIRLKKVGPAQPAEAAGADGRAEILYPVSHYSARACRRGGTTGVLD
jgi:hypothetical protein